jgi:hypothetical protein
MEQCPTSEFQGYYFLKHLNNNDYAIFVNKENKLVQVLVQKTDQQHKKLLTEGHYIINLHSNAQLLLGNNLSPVQGKEWSIQSRSPNIDMGEKWIPAVNPIITHYCLLKSKPPVTIVNFVKIVQFC